MRIRVLSDLHIEFERPELPPAEADAVVLAGDIGVGTAGVVYARETFPGLPVVYVPGNHEYYGHVFPRLLEDLDAAGSRADVRVLDDRTTTVAGVRFIGCTLWTDFELQTPALDARASMVTAAQRMADFTRIRCSPGFRRLTPRDTVSLHGVSRAFIERELATPHDGPTVVVTHHAPSIRSLRDEHRGDELSSAFASDLEALIEAFDIDLWIHGHTHHCVDYEIGATRVLSNQAGYPHEDRSAYDPALVVEL